MDSVDRYDFLNLTVQERTNQMQSHAGVLEVILKQQLGVDHFDEFGLPVQDVQRIFGRVVNLSTEDDKLKQDSIGLFNIQDGSSVHKLKLNLQEVP